MKKITINNNEANILEIDAKNKIVLIQYMKNSNGKVKLIQEWIEIEAICDKI